MKKALFITLALVLVAGFAVGAYAEERLKLSGEYRVRGFYTDNHQDGQSTFDDSQKNNNLSYFDQRFRMGGTITAAEGITANFRFDFGESTWGARTVSTDVDVDTALSVSLSNSAASNGRYANGTFGEFHIDRLYLRLERELFNFVAGQFNGAFGYTSAFETQQKWLLARFKTPVVIDLAYIKVDEGSGVTDESTLNTEDDTVFGLNAMFAQEAFTVGAFLGYRVNDTQNQEAFLSGTTATIDTSVNENDLTAFGVYGQANFGMMSFKGEFDFFDGESKTKGATTKTDIKGQQLWLYGDFKFGDNMKLPINFVYAKGYADKSNESQEWQIAPAFGDFVPQSIGAWGGDYLIFPGEEIWDPAGTGGGVMGLMVGFDFAAAEVHNFYTQIGYVEPDTVLNVTATVTGADTYESQYWIQGAWAWACLPSTELSANLLYTQPKFKDSTFKDDAGYALYTKLRVKF